MQKGSKKPVVLALLIITLGVAWLLATLADVPGINRVLALSLGFMPPGWDAKQVAPGVNWGLTLSLGIVGVMAFVVSSGVDKVNIVVGPYGLFLSLLLLLRPSKLLSLDAEIPISVIVIGVLMLISQFQVIPLPKWFTWLKAIDNSRV